MDRELEVIRLWSPVISFCRCYGVIPLKKSDQRPYFDRCFGSHCLSFLFSLNLIFNLFLATLVLMNCLDEPFTLILEKITDIIFYCQCELTLMFFFLNSESLLGLLQQWIDTEKALDHFEISLGKTTVIECWIFYVLTIFISIFDSLSFFFYDMVN